MSLFRLAFCCFGLHGSALAENDPYLCTSSLRCHVGTTFRDQMKRAVQRPCHILGLTAIILFLSLIASVFVFYLRHRDAGARRALRRPGRCARDVNHVACLRPLPDRTSRTDAGWRGVARVRRQR